MTIFQPLTKIGPVTTLATMTTFIKQQLVKFSLIQPLEQQLFLIIFVNVHKYL